MPILNSPKYKIVGIKKKKIVPLFATMVPKSAILSNLVMTPANICHKFILILLIKILSKKSGLST